jgi:hypothetical protein
MAGEGYAIAVDIGDGTDDNYLGVSGKPVFGYNEFLVFWFGYRINILIGRGGKRLFVFVKVNGDLAGRV